MAAHRTVSKAMFLPPTGAWHSGKHLLHCSKGLRPSATSARQLEPFLLKNQLCFPAEPSGSGHWCYLEGHCRTLWIGWPQFLFNGMVLKKKRKQRYLGEKLSERNYCQWCKLYACVMLANKVHTRLARPVGHCRWTRTSALSEWTCTLQIFAAVQLQQGQREARRPALLSSWSGGRCIHPSLRLLHK
jgi:hypothetical protein